MTFVSLRAYIAFPSKIEKYDHGDFLKDLDEKRAKHEDELEEDLAEVELDNVDLFGRVETAQGNHQHGHDGKDTEEGYDAENVDFITPLAQGHELKDREGDHRASPEHPCQVNFPERLLL